MLTRYISFLFLSILICNYAYSSELFDRVFEVKSGDQIDVFEVWNMSGDLAFKVVSKDGKNSASFWWISGGVVRQLGEKSGDFTIPYHVGLIPSKLRAGGFSSDTLIFVKENSRGINWSVTFDENGSLIKISHAGTDLTINDFKILCDVAKQCGDNWNCWVTTIRK